MSDKSTDSGCLFTRNQFGLIAWQKVIHNIGPSIFPLMGEEFLPVLGSVYAITLKRDHISLENFLLLSIKPVEAFTLFVAPMSASTPAREKCFCQCC
jgi:hypothetical protein